MDCRCSTSALPSCQLYYSSPHVLDASRTETSSFGLRAPQIGIQGARSHGWSRLTDRCASSLHWESSALSSLGSTRSSLAVSTSLRASECYDSCSSRKRRSLSNDRSHSG